MKRLNVFATTEEIEHIKFCANAPLLYLSGGKRMTESAHQAAHNAALAHGLPEIAGYYGIDLSNGEFVSV